MNQLHECTIFILVNNYGAFRKKIGIIIYFIYNLVSAVNKTPFII